MKPIDVNKSKEKHIKMVYNYNIINKKPEYKINDLGQFKGQFYEKELEFKKKYYRKICN